MARHKVLLIFGLLLFLSAEISLAQVATGTISGTVKDSSGAVLPGVHVVVLNEETGISRTLETNADGRYSAQSLSLGNYRVTGTLQGFQTEARTGIVLTVGREEVVDLSLGVGTVTQTVDVTGEAPLVESTTASLGSLVDDTTIRALPLNGRSYDQLALLQPGVVATDSGAPNGSPLQLGSGKRFTVGGQRPFSNLFLLDGTDINDQGNGTPGGAAGTNLGVDTILEFKIFTNSFKAEYGHSSGGIITAVTRSGTNSLHGTAFEFIRNSYLDARNYFDIGASPPPFRRNQFGGVLGGPIKKNKTFFFGGYEGLRQGLANTLFATVPTALARQGILPTGVGSTGTIKVPVSSAILPYLNFYYPLPNGRDFGDGTGQYVSSPLVATNEDNFMVRVDHQLSEKDSIFVRYVFDNDSLNAPQSLPSQLQASASRRQYVTAQETHLFGPSSLNNFRASFNRDHSTYNQETVPSINATLAFVPGQDIGAMAIGGLNVSGSQSVTTLGSGNGNGGNFWGFNNIEFNDDFSYLMGKHSFKTGVDIERIEDTYSNPAFLRGSYTFSTLNTFLAGTPSNFQVGSPLGLGSFWGIRQTLTGVYGQDDYAVNSRLTLNLGLRWEAMTDPYDANGRNSQLPSLSAPAMVVTNTFMSLGKKNFEPRVGLAWQVDASGKTVLRAGAGIYHDQMLPALYFVQLRTPPFFGTEVAKSPVPFPNGVQDVAQGLYALNVMNPVDKVPTDIQYNLSIQQQISKKTVLQVAYIGNKGDHLTTQTEKDTATPIFCSTSSQNCPAGLANGQVYYPAGSPRLNPAFAGIRYFQTNGTSIYDALSVSLRVQNVKGFLAEVFYTYSRADDLNSNTGSGDSTRSPNAIMNPFNPYQDWGRAEFDQTGRVGFNGTYQFPFRSDSRVLGAVVNGWTLDFIGTIGSGLPLSARLASSVSRDLSTQLAERPNLRPGFSNNPTSGVSAGCSGFAVGTQLGGAKNFYDPCAFSVPVAGTYGNLGRDTIIGPGLEDVDLALAKNFKLWEKVNVTFRGEMFNVLNHANFGLPNTNAVLASGVANASAGTITYTITSSRQLQFGLKINF
jgi:hypothetical protein